MVCKRITIDFSGKRTFMGLKLNQIGTLTKYGVLLDISQTETHI